MYQYGDGVPKETGAISAMYGFQCFLGIHALLELIFKLVLLNGFSYEHVILLSLIVCLILVGSGYPGMPHLLPGLRH